MKAMIVCQRNLEDIAEKEIKELVKTKTEVEPSVVVFEFSDFMELCHLAFSLQSAYYLLYLFFKGEFSSYFDLVKKIKKEIKKTKFPLFDSFSFRVIKEETIKGINKQKMEAEIGGLIKELTGKKVDLNNPQIAFCLYLSQNRFYFTFDFTGLDLSKRSYKIFLNKFSLKGPLAYSLVRLSGYQRKGNLLLPLIKDGTMAIEAGHYYLKRSVHQEKKEKFIFHGFKFLDLRNKKLFDFKEGKKQIKGIFCQEENKLNLKAAEKNIEVAGLKMKLLFRPIEDLDVIFSHNSMDQAVFYLAPPEEKRINELLYQLNYILKEKGKIVLMIRKNLSFRNEFFGIEETREIKRGELNFNILVLKKLKHPN